MQTIKKDLVIIGAGPGGLGAAIYAARAGLDFMVTEKLSPGGQIINTEIIENYLGFKEDISGFELMQKMIEHCLKFDIDIKEFFEIEKINENKSPKAYPYSCIAPKAKILTKTIILATGASPSRLGVKGEAELIGRGISFCATCDAALCRDKTVAVVGGGNAALEEAMFLTKFASRVYVIHRRDALRASKTISAKAMDHDKISFVLSSRIKEFIGGERLEKIVIKNIKKNKEHELDVDAVFEYVGLNPNSELVKGMVEVDESSFIVTDENMKTSREGLYAIGDVRNTALRQVITAVSDGAIAATAIEKTLI